MTKKTVSDNVESVAPIDVPFQPTTTTLVLVVTHLPFGCRENDLFRVFQESSDVKQILIFRSFSGESILGTIVSAKVIVSSNADPTEIIRILDKHVFLGRKMR